MAKNEFKFTKGALLAREAPDKRTWYYDTHQPGLAAAHLPSGVITFYVVRWFEGRSKQVRIGKVGQFSVQEAREEAARIQLDFNAGRDASATRVKGDYELMTMGALWSAYLNALDVMIKSGVRRAGTRKTYLSTWSQHLAPRFAGVRFCDAKADFVAREFLALQVGLQSGMYNKCIKVFRAMFVWAIQDAKWDIPGLHIDLKQVATDAREVLLEPKDVSRFFESVSQEQLIYQDIVFVLLFTTQRKMCVLSMEWRELDLDAGEWRIPAAKLKQRRGRVLVVPLIDPVLAILRRRLVEVRGRSKFVFPSQVSWSTTGHVYENGGASSFWRRIVVRAGLWSKSDGGLQIRDLRRTLASWAVRNKVDIKTVSTFLGHSNINMTSSVYAHLNTAGAADGMAVAANAILLAMGQAPPHEFSFVDDWPVERRRALVDYLEAGF